MGRIGPNEVRGGPNRVSAQRRRRLCRALRGALCGGLREGVREVVWMCGGVECVGTGRVAGRLRGECCGGECCGGRAIGMEGGRGTAAERAVVMKGRVSRRGGCREPAEGIAAWMVWEGRGRATVGSCGPLPCVMTGSFCWKEDPLRRCALLSGVYLCSDFGKPFWG